MRPMTSGRSPEYIGALSVFARALRIGDSTAWIEGGALGPRLSRLAARQSGFATLPTRR